MVRRTYDRGDIVNICLNTTEGKEVQGNFRPCLVLSTQAFNQVGVAYVAPITQGGNFARERGFTVSLSGSGTKTQGVVLVHAIKSLDLMARRAKFVKRVPSTIVDEVLAKVRAIFD